MDTIFAFITIGAIIAGIAAVWVARFGTIGITGGAVSLVGGLAVTAVTPAVALVALAVIAVVVVWSEFGIDSVGGAVLAFGGLLAAPILVGVGTLLFMFALFMFAAWLLAWIVVR